jgi:hypothetical protein
VLRAPFRRHRGTITAVLGSHEAALLQQVAGDLGVLLERAPKSDPRDDPVLDRLYPRAYLDPTEEEAEEEWQALVHGELVRARENALSVFAASLRRARSRLGRVEVDLSPEEAEAWLGVLNDARLALGTRLGVTEDLEPSAIRSDHPEADAYAVYWWLGWVEEHLVEALAS